MNGIVPPYIYIKRDPDSFLRMQVFWMCFGLGSKFLWDLKIGLIFTFHEKKPETLDGEIPICNPRYIV